MRMKKNWVGQRPTKRHRILEALVGLPEPASPKKPPSALFAGEIPIRGRLPVTLADDLPRGHGLTR